MTEVQNEGNSVRLSGRSIQSGGSERGMVGGRSRFFENGCCRCRRDTGARTRPQLGGPGVDEQRRGRALCKADFKFRCGPPCPHTSAHPCVGKEARDCTQFRLQEEYGHTDGRRHASGFVQSVGRVALDKLARFKSNLNQKGRESLWTATEGANSSRDTL